MDKLRALQYFIAAAEEGSFSGAARRLEVSVPAVGKMINALERTVGATLVERSPRGLVVTADGGAAPSTETEGCASGTSAAIVTVACAMCWSSSTLASTRLEARRARRERQAPVPVLRAVADSHRAL